MFHCLVIKVVCLATALLFYHVVFSLSRTFLNSSIFFNTCSLQQLFDFITSLFALSRTFSFFFRKKRRRRDLNPRAAINDLLPFQGSPFGQLGYFSKRPRFVICISQITVSHFRALYQVLTFLSKSLMHYIVLSVYLSSTFFKFFKFFNFFEPD